MHDQIRSSPSRPNPTSDGGLAEWTISKEQWDAYAEPMSKTMRSTTAVTVVAGTVVVYRHGLPRHGTSNLESLERTLAGALG